MPQRGPGSPTTAEEADDCDVVVSGVLMLTAITFRATGLWGAHHVLIPGAADVDPLPLP